LSWLLGGESEGQKLIWPQAVEQTIKMSAHATAAKLGAVGIEGPFAVAFTLLRIRDYTLWRDFFAGREGIPAWRDQLSLPLIVVDILQPDALLPLAHSFWLAFGERRPDGPLGQVA
jgi:hypothetical protein